MFPDGGLAGLIDGGFLALPSTRPDGSYYTLLTIGFAEICRIFVQKQKPLTPMNGSINNVDSFIPDERFLQRPGLLLGFAGAFALMLLAPPSFRIVNSERLGMLVQTAREDDAFAEAIVRHGLHLHGVNRPVRCMTGHDWRGEDSYRLAQKPSAAGRMPFPSSSAAQRRRRSRPSICPPSPTSPMPANTSAMRPQSLRPSLPIPRC